MRKNLTNGRKTKTWQWIALGVVYVVNILFLILIILFAIFGGQNPLEAFYPGTGSQSAALMSAPVPTLLPPSPTPEAELATPTLTATQLPDTIALQSVTPTTGASPSPGVSPTLGLTPTAAGDAALTSIPAQTSLPEAALVENITGHKQSMGLDCESRSAVDWAGFFGRSIDELEFANRIPISDNPEVGFAGDMDGEWGHLPPGPYGVYAGPVAEVLKQYGVNALAKKHLRWADIQAEIVAGRPVIVWVVGHVGNGKATTYKAKDGQVVVVARREHTVMVTGYTAKDVMILDGGSRYTRDLTTFLNSWSVLENMAIVAGEPVPLK